MSHKEDERTALLLPFFQKILQEINPTYRSVEITGNSKVRYLKYRYRNEKYEPYQIDIDDFLGFLLFFPIIMAITSLLFRIPNVFWSNFSFYIVCIGYMIISYKSSNNIKDFIVTSTITLIYILLTIGISYWISKAHLPHKDAVIFCENISALWPDFIFKFVFKWFY